MSSSPKDQIKVIILGAAGRDFHDFNTVWRNDPRYHVVAFTAAQIPDIEGRTYPATLCGERYPSGIPIEPEEKLAELIQTHGVDQVAMAYSDLPHEEVMHKAALANAAGAVRMQRRAGAVPFRRRSAARSGLSRAGWGAVHVLLGIILREPGR